MHKEVFSALIKYNRNILGNFYYVLVVLQSNTSTLFGSHFCNFASALVTCTDCTVRKKNLVLIFAPYFSLQCGTLGYLSAFSMTPALVLLFLSDLQYLWIIYALFRVLIFFPSPPSLSFTSARELHGTEGGDAFPPSEWKMVYPKSIFALSSGATRNVQMISLLFQ